MYHDLDDIFDAIQEEKLYASALTSKRKLLDAAGQMGGVVDHISNVRTAHQFALNPVAATVKHVTRTPPLKPPLPQPSTIMSFMKGAGGKALMSNIQTQVIITVIKSLAQFISFIYSWKQIHDSCHKRSSNVFEETDEKGYLKYPKEALVYHSLKGNEHEMFDYFTCQFVAECVTCHMIASHKPFINKYTLAKFRAITPEEVNHKLRDFLISFTSTLKIVFSEDTNHLTASCSRCSDNFRKLLSEMIGQGGRKTRENVSMTLSEGVQKFAEQIVHSIVFVLGAGKEAHAAILLPFITNMLVIAITYPRQTYSLLHNTKIGKCHNSLRPIFKDLFDFLGKTDPSLLAFVGSNLEGKVDKIKTKTNKKT